MVTPFRADFLVNFPIEDGNSNRHRGSVVWVHMGAALEWFRLLQLIEVSHGRLHTDLAN